MKNLTFTTEELELMNRFEDITFDDKKTTRLMWWFGQDRKEPSRRQILREMGMDELASKFIKLQREGKMEMMSDDGTFHCTFSNELLEGLNLEQFEEI